MNWNCSKCGKRADMIHNPGYLCTNCHCQALEGSFQCRECSRWYNQSLTMRHLRAGLCFNCDFWQDRVDEIGTRTHLVINGHHYSDCGPGKGDGFGGDRFVYQRLDEATPRETRNMWHQGTVPAHLRARLPDNARFLHNEPDWEARTVA